MASLMWKNEQLKEKSVDLDTLRLIRANSIKDSWMIECDRLVYEPAISRRLYINGTDECSTKVFTINGNTQEIKDTGIQTSNVSYMGYNQENNCVILFLHNGDKQAVSNESYCIYFAATEQEILKELWADENYIEEIWPPGAETQE